MTALATRPSDLRVAARSLLVVGSELEEVAAQLARSQGAVATSWQGVAALGQRAATERVHVAVLARCEPVRSAGRALGVLADQAEEAQAVVRTAQRARAEAQAERARTIRLLASTTDAVTLEVLRERITVLDSVIRRAEDEIERAERLLEQGRGVVERVLHDSWGLGFEDLGDLVDVGKTAGPIWRGGGLIVVGTRVILTARKLGMEVNPFIRYMLQARLDRLLKIVMKRPIMGALIGLGSRVAIPILVISEAVPDLMDGGGYTGVRGFTLRVTAALAIPGSIAMVVPHPVVAGVGAVVVGAYFLAKAGFTLYDHRILLAEMGKMLWQRRESIIRKAEKILAPSPMFPLGPLGPLVPIGRGRDLIPDLPRLEDLGRFLPGIGGPIAIPSIPIAPGLRLPVVPPPLLGPGGPIVPALPWLGKLF